MKNKQNNSFVATQKLKSMIDNENVSCTDKINFINNNPVNPLAEIVVNHEGKIITTGSGVTPDWRVERPASTIWGVALVKASMPVLWALAKKIENLIDVNNSFYIVRREKEFDPNFIRMLDKNEKWSWVEAMLSDYIAIRDEEDIQWKNKSLYEAILMGRELERVGEGRQDLLDKISTDCTGGVGREQRKI